MSQPVRVLHVYKDFFPVVGGIENHIKLLTRELARSGEFEPIVLVVNTGRRTTTEYIDGVKVLKAGRLGHAASTPLSLELFRMLARQDADIAHLHFPYPPGELAQLLFGRSRRLVVTYHSDVVRQKRLRVILRPMVDAILTRANRIIVTSPQYLETSSILRGFLPKCVVSTIGIDPEPLASTPEIRRKAVDLRARLGKPVVLFVGKLRYYKGLPFLIGAMRSVDAKLVIVGEGPDEGALRQSAKHIGVADKVLFVGHVPASELPAYYHAADVFALPSTQRSEALGTSLVEAMACGLPIVSTALGTGTSYVNVHEVTGLVVEPGNTPALAEALTRLLNDASLRQAFGDACRRRREEIFGVRPMVERVTQVYRDVLTAEA